MQLGKNAVRWLVIMGLLMGSAAAGAQAAPQRGKTPPGKQRLLGKRCSQCGHSISLNSQVGQKCPYCGVRWGRVIRKQAGAPATMQAAKPAPKPVVKPKAKPKVKAKRHRRHRHRHSEDDWFVRW